MDKALELICDDERVDEAITLIRKNARTGQDLADWIYIYDKAKTVPIKYRSMIMMNNSHVRVGMRK